MPGLRRDRLAGLDEEFPELGGAVAAVQGADDGAVVDAGRGEQAGDPVPVVVAGAPFGHPRHHRQYRPGPVQGLDLALLIDAQHHRLIWRVVAEPGDIDDLAREQRAGGEPEPVGQVRLQAGLPPDPADRRG